MQLLVFKINEELRLGIKTEAGIIDVAAAGKTFEVAELPTSVEAFYARGSDALRSLETLRQKVSGSGDWLLNEDELSIAPVVPNPGKILCVGLNYRQHADESGLDYPETPILFSKFNNAIAAAGEVVPLPKNAEQHDYEAELVVVIGKQGKFIPQEEALDYVLGYCNGNDLSTRDLQFRTNQWLLGKTLDKFLPVGPYVVTDISNPQDLSIKCWLNGEERQNSNTSDMIFSVAEVISYASQYMTLSPGDIISTGTPEGVILGMEEKVWLQPGDEVVVEIGPLGRLINKMG